MRTFPRRSKLLIAFLCLVVLLLMSAADRAPVAQAAGSGRVSLDQPTYTAHESQGALQITIQRTGDLTQAEHLGYGVKRQDAQPGIDFRPINNTYITMAPGQSSYTFRVPIIDQGMHASPVYALAYLYGAWPESLGANSNSIITILHDDPLQVRDAANPLGVERPAAGNLLAGAKLYVDPSSPSALARRHYRRSNPAWAGLLGDIAGQAGAHRFYMWNMVSTVTGQVAHYLEETQRRQPGSTVMLSTYSLVHGHCGSTATRDLQARYENFIRQVAAGIGNFRVVFFLELDSLITAPCLAPAQLSIRQAELRYAVSVLEADPHVLVYLDGGAADAVPAARQAQFLDASGIGQAQGFFLNSTHFDWMTKELNYGARLSNRLSGAHFIINSAENGRGPLVPPNRVRNGNEVLCNPPGRGLGPLSVARGIAQPTGYAAADGFLWFSNPGGSGGQCVPGAPPTGAFWPAYAVMLARNWVHRVTGPSSFGGAAAERRGHHSRPPEASGGSRRNHRRGLRVHQRAIQRRNRR